MIKITTDSTCDLSREILDKYDISLSSLSISIDDKVYRHRIDITPDDFHSIIEELAKEPTTGMPSPTDYMSIMKQAVEDGYTSIFCICMSSGTSGSYQSAIIAKDYFYEENNNSKVNIHIVDSRSMSHGSGWLIIKSARLRENEYLQIA